MPTIRTRKTKDGEPRYEVQVRVAGSPPQIATFRKLKDAQRWGQEREIEAREKRQFGRTLSSKRTLADAIDRYTEEHIERLALSGRVGRERHLRYWRERCGHFRLVELTADHFTRAARELESGGAGPATVNRYLAAISRVLSIAEREWRWIERNHLRGVGRRKEPPGRVRFLTEDECHRLLTACRESSTAGLYPMVLLALATGGRAGELAGLQWEEVDFRRGSITFNRTKNAERRSVPMTSPARDALALLDPKPSGPVFVQTSYRTAWESARDRAGLPAFRFHDLRHTAASWLAMSGASLLEIAEILGHKTLAMVKRYAHLSTLHLNSVSERMASQFLKPQGPSDPQASD